MKVNTPDCGCGRYRTLTLDADSAYMNANLLEGDRRRVQTMLDELNRIIALNDKNLGRMR